LREEYLELTYLDLGPGELQLALAELLKKRSELGLNRVCWWGGLELRVKFEDQCAGILGRASSAECSENASAKLS
jgi:hypothetical protein